MSDLKKSNKPFRPRARIMELLGEQLIKNHTLALFELIKNSYDADAGVVSILMLDIDKGEDGGIEIQDDGDGMSYDLIENVWLEPADGYKNEIRRSNIRSKKGRLPIGEKGVGRFAVHRLGKQIELVTRMAGMPEVVVKINWSDDVEKYKYLDEAKIFYYERIPDVFKENDHGTRITITKLKQQWTRRDIRQLYRSVFSMTSSDWLEKNNQDFDKVVPIGIDNFKVEFSLEPNQEWLDHLIRQDEIRDQAMFFFDFLIDENGFHWSYKFSPLTGLANDYKDFIKGRELSKIDDKSFEFFKLSPPEIGENWKGKHRKKRENDGRSLLQGIGPIRGRIAGFDFDNTLVANYMPEDSEGLIKFLKRQGGMKVYRDGVRVYDYGEPGNDWLRLDERRVQIPYKRLSNNLLLGEIHLRLDQSTNLIEQTNREGFMDNNAFDEFRYAVLCALMRFEVEREKDKSVIRECLDFGQKKQNNPKGNSTEDAIEDLKHQIRNFIPHKDLIDYVLRVEKSYKETRDTLLSAVGSGLGLSVVFHELERGVRGLHRAIQNNRSVKDLLVMANSLEELLKGTSFLVSNNKSEKIKASELVKYALFSTQERFGYHEIPFKNGFDLRPDLDFEIKGVRRMYTAALVNLIDNAIHWIKMSSEEADRENQLIWIGPSQDFDAPAILVADSGSGFEDPKEDLIKPFFTRRSEGMGIGLYYCNMVMKSHGGRLAFPSHGDVDVPKRCTGALVALVFGGVE